MFCSKCGSYIDDGQNFCPHCGASMKNGSNPDGTGSYGQTEATGGLKVWLWFIIIVNGISLIYALINFSVISAAALALNILGAYSMLKLHKGGFYILCLSSLIALIYNLSLGVGMGYALLGICGPLILWLLIWKQWGNFR